MSEKKLTEKVNICVEAWNEDQTYLGTLDISELKPGMFVRGSEGFLKIIGATIDGTEDYYVATEDGYYSPLCLD